MLTPLTSLPGYKTVTYSNAKSYYVQKVAKTPISTWIDLSQFHKWLREQDFAVSSISFYKRLILSDFLQIEEGGIDHYGGNQEWFVNATSTANAVFSALESDKTNDDRTVEKARNMLFTKYNGDALNDTGCGLVAAANITAYNAIYDSKTLGSLYTGNESMSYKSKSDFLIHMMHTALWVIPTIAGIPLVDMWKSGVKDYAKRLTDCVVKKFHDNSVARYSGNPYQYNPNIEKNNRVSSQ